MVDGLLPPFFNVPCLSLLVSDQVRHVGTANAGKLIKKYRLNNLNHNISRSERNLRW